MSAQSPSSSVPSQPPKAAAYSSAGAKPNPITRNLSECAVADSPGSSHAEGSSSGDYLTARRTADDQSSSSGMPQSQERGVRGGAPTSERERRETHYASENSNQQETYETQDTNAEGEKMAPASEGKVADAVHHDRSSQRRATSGSPHGRVRGEVSLDEVEGDLERKKAQQEVMRRQVMEARERGEDVDGRREHEKKDVTGEGRREQINLV
ncbi:hypothetical protein QBC43DRAFT_311345 [Cladorrhinum sp. PSN259]|nr:hypothetical protein QBC43DRAFT_311345 [Cladorrhinum sp. PSN259]